MGDNQINKFFAKGREKSFGMVAPTLSNPDVVIEKDAQSPNAERNTKYLFIKTFIKSDGSRYVHFETVTVRKDGMEVSISSHEVDRKVAKKEMQNGIILHLNNKLSLDSERYLIETQNDGRPDLVPASDNNISKSQGNVFAPITEDTNVSQFNSPTYKYSQKNPIIRERREKNAQEEERAEQQLYPVDESGEPLWYEMTGEQFDVAMAELGDTAGAFIADKIKEAQKAKEKAEKAKPKSTEFAKRKAEQQAITAEKAAAQKAYDFWTAQQARRIGASPKKAPQVTQQVGENITGKYQTSNRTYGNTDTYILPNGEKINGRYVIVEADAITPSHDVNNGYQKSEGFPTDENGNTINDRDYQADKSAQTIVEQNAANYDARAIQTPVIVTNQGIVLSGNGRTMSGQIAAGQGTDTEYLSYLKGQAGKYGFTAEQVASYKHPRLVLEIDGNMPLTAATFSKFNAEEKKTVSPTEKAVKAGKTVKDITLEKIAALLDDKETLSDVYADETATARIIKILQSDGVININEVAELMDGKKLSAQGKDFLETLLVGKILNEQSVRLVAQMRNIRATVIKSIMPLLNNSRLRKGQNGENYSLSDELNKAIEFIYAADRANMPITDYISQTNLFDANPADIYDAATQIIAVALTKGQNNFKQFVNKYNTAAEHAASGQIDIFAGRIKTKKEILNELIEEYGNTGQAAADTQSRLGNSKVKSGIQSVRGDDAGNGRTADTGGRGGKRGRSIEQERVNLYRSTVKESKGLNTGSYDSQGNPVDSNGKLLIDKLEDISDLTNEDFITPTRNVELPQLQQNISNAIGADSKPIIIKKNIFEKNRIAHPELTPEQSRDILKKSLYITTFIGRTQPIKRPNYWIAVQTADKNSITVLEVNKGKDNVEIVGWRRIDYKGIEKLKRQAEREGGQFLILTSKDAAAALSALPSDKSFNSKYSKESSNGQEPPRHRTGEEAGSRDIIDMTEEELAEIRAKEREKIDRIFGKEYLDNVAKAVEKRKAERKAVVSKAARELRAELTASPDIVLVSDLKDIPEEDLQGKTPQEAIRRMRAKGWYTPGNGKVYINLSMHSTAEDVKATILHEAVAHKGLRALLGEESFGALCDAVYRSMPKKRQKAYEDTYKKIYPNAAEAELRRIIADEYMARLAEGGVRQSIPQRIISAIREFLRSIGIDLDINDADIRHLLAQSYKNMQEADAVKVLDNSALLARLRKAAEETHIKSEAESLYRIDYSAEKQDIITRAQADGTWMKAPNGKPTNLTERQWVQVRTKAFKEWFGDWEKAAKYRMINDIEPTVIKNILDSKAEAFKFYGNIRDVINKTDGRKVRFFNTAFDKVYRDGGLFAKSITGLKECFENSICAYSEKDNRGGVQRWGGSVHKTHPNIDFYHNYIGKVSIHEKECFVRFTVQEEKSGGNGVHSFFVSEVELYEKGQDTQTRLPLTRQKNGQPALTDAKLQKFLEEAKDAAENASKVVDENGEPRVIDGLYLNIKERNPITRLDISINKANNYVNKISEIENETGMEWDNESIFYQEEKAYNLLESIVSQKDYIEILINSIRKGIIPSIVVAYRYGDINERERSYNYRDQIFEQGISVVGRASELNTNIDKYYELFYGEQPYNIVVGVYSGNRGADGEILLTPATKLGLVENLGNIIKSATDNTGSFSSENADIRFRMDNDLEAINKRFNEELERYQHGKMSKNEMFHLGLPNGIMSIFLPNLPIVMRQKVVNKAAKKKHDVEVSSIMNMPQKISEPIFIFKKDNKSLSILSEMKDRVGRNVFVALDLLSKIQDGKRYIEVNNVTTVHGSAYGEHNSPHK